MCTEVARTREKSLDFDTFVTFNRFYWNVSQTFFSFKHLILAHNKLDEVEPEFLAALGNMSVTQGRDISFTCVVNNLGPYKVSNGT